MSRRDAEWAEAKKRCRLSVEDVRMAKEMGLNPRSLIKNIPSKSEPWKAPVRYWVREIYRKRQEKAAARKKRRAEKEDRPAEADATMTEGAQPDARLIVNGDFLLAEAQKPAAPDRHLQDLDASRGESLEFKQDVWEDGGPLSENEIADENRRMWRRQQEFRIAAEYVATAFASVEEVEKVVLFGSVALPLKKEVPRFTKFRRSGIDIWHECKDLDLAVWLSGLGCLEALRRASAGALNHILREKDIGVAHHQLDVFIMEVGTGRYLGRLCCFRECPRGKPECDVPACGATPLLKQHNGFTFNPQLLRPDTTVLLFDRRSPCANTSAEEMKPL